MAFALRLKCGGNGNGRGILLFDFEEAPHELFRASFGLDA